MIKHKIAILGTILFLLVGCTKKEPQPTATQDPSASPIQTTQVSINTSEALESNVEQIKNHIVESGIYNEYMTIGGFNGEVPTVVLNNGAIDVTAQNEDGITLKFGYDSTEKFSILEENYQTQSSFKYKKEGVEKEAIYKHIILSPNEVEISLETTGGNFSVSYDTEKNQFLDAMQGESFGKPMKLTLNLNEGLLAKYQESQTAFTLLYENQRILLLNIEKILNGESDLIAYIAG